MDRPIEDGRRDDITLVLAFSGGGSRAAALAYGVLQELRDTRIGANPVSVASAARPMGCQ